MRTIACLAIAMALSAAGECIEVTGDRIRAGDLAPYIPEFSASAPDKEVAISPLPGAVRQLRADDLSRVLGSPVASGVCVVRKTRTLNTDEIVTAMRSSIPDPNVRLSVVDYSRPAVPPGVVEFPLSGLAPPSVRAPATALMWRGRVRYDGGRSVAVWARVRLSTTAHVLVASRQLRLGEPISRVDVEEKTIDYAGITPPGAIDLEKVLNSETSREITAGTVIDSSMLRSRAALRKGDTIRVAVKAAGAELKFDATAETTGRVGDRVLVRNPLNGRMVSARIRGDHEATIEVGANGHVQ